MRKIIAAVCALVIISGGAFGAAKYKNSMKSEAKTVQKEVTVQYGSITAGITESSSVNVDSLEQTYDLSLTAVSVSASTESGSSSGSKGGSSSGGGMSGMGGRMSFGGGMGMSSGGGMPVGSTNVSTSSNTSSVELIIDKVLITEGQTVSKGDIIMTITEESISAARAELEKSITDAELALTQAKIDEDEKMLTAKYEYDKRIAEGETAQSTYNAALDEISSNISSLQSQIAELESQLSGADNDRRTQIESQLKNYRSQLSSAQSTRSANELSAKQTYEETLMYYQNAKSLYNIAVSDVGNATASAQETVDTAKENLAVFEEYVADGNIKAEYSGTITGVGYSSGDTLSADTPIASYADAETITVTVNVTEDDISAVSLDDTVQVTFLSYPDDVFSGYVSKIGSSTSNSSTVSYPVTIVVTSFPETLLTGMTANVTFISKQVNDVMYVSNKAVTKNGTESFVTKKNPDGSSSEIKVKTGFSDGTFAEISGDISVGDTLIIKGRE